MPEEAKLNFLKSYDFMKLGQALNHGNWQIAMVTLQRMQKNVRDLGLDTFERQLVSIRQCIIHKQGRQAKDILALMIAKRAQLLKQSLQEDTGQTDTGQTGIKQADTGQEDTK